MPALPPVAKVLKAVWSFYIGEDLGAKCINYWQYTGAGASGTDLATLAGNMGTDWSDAFAPLYTADRTLESVELTDLTAPTAPQASATISVVGTNADTKLPASAAFVISDEIARRYRGGHPRNYWPLGGEADLFDAQTWTTDFVAAVTAAQGVFLADLPGALVPGVTTLSQVNVSFYFGFTLHTGTTGRVRNVPTPRAVPLVDPVTSQIFRQGIGQVRRRLLHLA